MMAELDALTASVVAVSVAPDVAASAAFFDMMVQTTEYS